LWHRTKGAMLYLRRLLLACAVDKSLSVCPSVPCLPFTSVNNGRYEGICSLQIITVVALKFCIGGAEWMTISFKEIWEQNLLFLSQTEILDTPLFVFTASGNVIQKAEVVTKLISSWNNLSHNVKVRRSQVKSLWTISWQSFLRISSSQLGRLFYSYYSVHWTGTAYRSLH